MALAARFGLLPAALGIAFLGTLGDVGWTFQALRPGHQGLHVVFGAISVIGLVFGGMGLTMRQVQGPTRWALFRLPEPLDLQTARRWFSLAGIATGLALWVSATIESFFIYALVGTVVLLLVLVPRERVILDGLAVEPELWRRWGLTAGATGLGFYLLEYFPHHMGMRMEVNHPIYDLAVVGCGEFFRALTAWRWGAHRWTKSGLLLAVAALVLALLPVLLVTFGPLGWHHMRDPQMLRYHNFIQEFYTYVNFIKTNRLGHFLDLFGILPLLCLLVPLFLLRRDLTATQVMWLSCPFAFACGFGALGYLQIRWLGFFASAVCLSALTTAHFAYSLLPVKRTAIRALTAGVLVVGLLVQPAIFCRRQIIELQADLDGKTIQSELITPILNKRMAYALKESAACPRAVIADPNLAPSLGYFAGIPTMTSFYWENTEGLHNAVRFFATEDPAEAHEIAHRTGATHVMIPDSALLPNYLYFVAHGHYDTAGAANTFVARLLAGKVPLWIGPDTVLNFITTTTYSYRGTPVGNHVETFRIQE